MRSPEITALCENINKNEKMNNDMKLRYERENDYHCIRLYVKESCKKTLFIGTSKEILSQLYAFRNGLTFQSSDFVR